MRGCRCLLPQVCKFEQHSNQGKFLSVTGTLGEYPETSAETSKKICGLPGLQASKPIVGHGCLPSSLRRCTMKKYIERYEEIWPASCSFCPNDTRSPQARKPPLKFNQKLSILAVIHNVFPSKRLSSRRTTFSSTPFL
jgi:hypothetical protein